MPEVTSSLYYAFIISASIIGGIWSLFIWLDKRITSSINAVISKMDSIVSNMVDRIEHHEETDNARFEKIFEKFESILKEVWQLKVKAAVAIGNLDGKKE